MPREYFEIAPPADDSHAELQRFATDVQNAFLEVSRQLAEREGLDGLTPSFSTDIDMQGHKVTELGAASEDEDAVRREEFARRVGSAGASRIVVLDAEGDFYTPPIYVAETAIFSEDDSVYALGDPALCFTNIYADAGVTVCSMRKYKGDIRPQTLGLEFLLELLDFSWVWKGRKGAKNEGRFRGFIAEDVLAALDEVGYEGDFAGVVQAEDGEGNPWFGMRYEQFVPILVKALKEVYAEVVALRNRVDKTP